MPSPFEYVRDRAADEIKYASSTVSQNARTIGIALVFVVYSLVAAGDKAGFIRHFRIELLLAGLFGILCIALDYLQYYCVIWENRSIVGTLRAEKIAILELEQTDPPAALARMYQLRQSLDFLRARTPWSRRREWCFHAKLVAAMLGVLLLAFTTLRIAVGNIDPVLLPG
jgi:hypothetical protein